ncbi:hypothetical protein FGE12_11100 [Aggregicoccus sp. 17bor-14]|uniref:hypothetical protein n=1 Tax=Myxococcaceae TaxID=31 RepID=UPI00129C22E7|nr:MULTISPECIES: hypothetical protein [Myxococcaceae]MBF5042936.1 hypothetical protein [Simulacricoccus sp. 17bor-14]MRI88702.1 hypothetical protein [Aggregicoccus sp. 17bor-14]
MDLLDLLRLPPVACLLFCTLHSLDFLLTIAGERVRQRRAAQVIRISGSYELNPLFRKVVDERRWWSWRFLLTLGVGGAVFYVASWSMLSTGRPDDLAALDLVLGAFVFSRLHIIQRHLHNLWLFDRIARHPESAVGEVHYERRVGVAGAAFQSGGAALLLAAAYVAAPSAFVLGGALSCGLLTLLGVVLALRAKPATAAAASGAPTPS